MLWPVTATYSGGCCEMRRHDAKIDRLAGVPLFAGIDRRHLDRIAALCTDIAVPAGQVLCRQGQHGSEFFVIENGTASVTVDGRPAGTLGPGDFFGELALLDGGERSATVV